MLLRRQTEVSIALVSLTRIFFLTLTVIVPHSLFCLTLLMLLDCHLFDPKHWKIKGITWLIVFLEAAFGHMCGTGCMDSDQV